MEKLPSFMVNANNVKPLKFGDTYESRMILDHAVTGRDNVIQINHGTVAPRSALAGAAHEEDEIYYILSGAGKLNLDGVVHDIRADDVVFIPAGVFHALDNSDGDEPMKLLTFWRDYRFNEAYEERIRQWGTSFKMLNDK